MPKGTLRYAGLPLMLVLLAAARAAEAGAYYVATTGSDSNGGTQDQPFRTIRKAVGLVKLGDTVLVRAGRCAGKGWRSWGLRPSQRVCLTLFRVEAS